jgi:microphthalmia-associated transcription factor
MFQFRTTHPTSSEQIVEKQKKRKESHNAVERRRRDHINEMIHQLGCLVEDGEGEAGRMNKGEILQKAVERIHVLEKAVELQGARLALVDPTYKLPEIVVESASIPEEA